MDDFNLKMQKVKNNNFPTIGMIIISVLGIFGIVLLYVIGVFNVSNMSMLIEYMAKDGIAITICLFFIGICIYCWILYFFNVIIPPKKEIVYLYKKKHIKNYFVNKKGKKITYPGDNLKENTYYYVLKTRNYIYDVLGETGEIWEPKSKVNYLLSFCTSTGLMEDCYILPLVYVMILPGLFCLFVSEEGIVNGVIFLFVPMFIIFYDLFYRIKFKKKQKKHK